MGSSFDWTPVCGERNFSALSPSDGHLLSPCLLSILSSFVSLFLIITSVTYTFLFMRHRATLIPTAIKRVHTFRIVVVATIFLCLLAQHITYGLMPRGPHSDVIPTNTSGGGDSGNSTLYGVSRLPGSYRDGYLFVQLGSKTLSIPPSESIATASQADNSKATAVRISAALGHSDSGDYDSSDAVPLNVQSLGYSNHDIGASTPGNHDPADDGESSFPSTLDIVSFTLDLLSWVCHALFIHRMSGTFPRYVRGPVLVLLSYILTVGVSAYRLYAFARVGGAKINDGYKHWGEEENGGDSGGNDEDGFYGDEEVVYTISDAERLRQRVSYIVYCVVCACHLFYLASLVPTGRTSLREATALRIQRGGNDSSAETESLLQGHSTVYNTFDAASASLGRGERGGYLSRLFFWWVGPLMAKGKRGELKSGEDTFTLPEKLNTSKVTRAFCDTLRTLEREDRGRRNGDDKGVKSSLSSSRDVMSPPGGITEPLLGRGRTGEEEVSIRRGGGTGPSHDVTISSSSSENDMTQSSSSSDSDTVSRRARKPRRTLVISMHRCFGGSYYFLGLLKLLADGLGFAGPMLLNALILYMENPGEAVSHGYAYAAGLLGTTLVSALLTTHFDYQVKMTVLKARTALVSAVYRRTLSASTVSLSAFSSGEVINFMSTDVDRIVNFFPSFHQFWSLPFQIAVSLYLLYLQVGLAFLSGLAFAILLIPINKCIAQKIGTLSTEMMKHKDARVKLMNEALFGIRVVKLFAWEEYFKHRVAEKRQAEVACLKGRKYLDALCVYFWATTPVVISILTFTTYALMGNALTAAKVFTSIALFNMLVGPLNAFPWVVNGMVESWVSTKRVQRFLHLRPTNPAHYWVEEGTIGQSGTAAEGTHVRTAETVLIENGQFTWEGTPEEITPDSKAQEESTAETGQSQLESSGSDEGREKKVELSVNLCNINIRLRKGELLGVVGKVGSGKTSLLMALLNEMRRTDGTVQLASRGGVAVVTQEPWIQQGTLRSNVLFGQPYNHIWYQQVTDACALSEDFQNLAEGDKTEVGENGVTLSGGQKARLTLARAVYQNKSVYLIDDPLAAVDAKVANHLFTACIQGLLAEKTVVLCTHHAKYLWEADAVVAMDRGLVVAAGTPQTVLTQLDIDRHQDPSADPDTDPETPGDGSPPGGTKLTPPVPPGGAVGLEAEAGPVVQEEAKNTGTVKLAVYKAYSSSVGHVLFGTIMVSVVLMQGSKNVTDWWLSYWVTNTNDTITPDDSNTTFYLEIYAGLAGGNTVLTLLRAFLFAYGGVVAASSVHNKLLEAVMKGVTSFFDRTPMGRIINRFSTDVYTVDDSLPFTANIFLSQTAAILGTVAITLYGLPYFAIVLGPLVAVYYYIQGYYRNTSREVKRITSTTMSNVYAHLNESVEGRVLIRAFDKTTRFERDNEHRLNMNMRAQFTAAAATLWLNIRLQGLGVAMVTAVAFIAVIEHSYHGINPGLVGLAVSYALSVTNLLSGVVGSFTDTEKKMVSVERVIQYIDGIPPETDESHEGSSHVLSATMPISPSWPARGLVSFNDVCLRYADKLPLVLSGLSFETRPGEKIGIVGRTGSGKSSLFNVLFRMVQSFSGSVLIDGVDIRSLPLQKLRSSLAIIPQTPFLFSGTIRENLDPLGRCDDALLWSSLEKCELRDVVQRLGGLDHELPERGANLSIGQRQLFCLARALLIGAKVLCIDEATANVDLATDSLIQTTIQREFASSTVFTIAHRVNTVLQSDRIMVLRKGRVLEMDTPTALLSNSESALTAIVNESG